MSNSPSDLDKGTKSLTHIVYIPKTTSQRIANFVSEFSGRKDSKPKKKIYTSRLRAGLEAYLASTTSIASSTPNYYRLIREHWKSHPLSNHRKGLGAQSHSNQRHYLGTRPAVIVSSSFTNASDIPKVLSSPTKAPSIGYFLWHGHCCCIRIKDSIPTARALCKYT